MPSSAHLWGLFSSAGSCNWSMGPAKLKRRHSDPVLVSADIKVMAIRLCICCKNKAVGLEFKELMTNYLFTPQN